MINTKRPSTDDYTQVGFVEAKDTQGNYQNIDHIYDTQGNIVFQQGYLNEYQGADNFSIPAIGKPLLDYTIYGNTVQSTTPTPQTPVIPNGTGERTGNLLDYTTVESTSYATATPISGGITISGQYFVQFRTVKFTVGSSYTMSWTAKTISGTVRIMWRFRYSDNTHSVMPSSGMSLVAEKEVSALLLYVNGSSTESGVAEITNIMLNEGSTALPYEPYGYKIPISSANTTTPIYLGEVETTRKIKKLVLTGDENVTMPATSSFQILGVIQWGDINGFCTHYPQITWNEVSYATKNGFAIRASSDGADRFRICDLSITTVADFKAYLAQQYANGTPVTVWYVLATPETAVVNEPLMKIGDYVDTLSMEQAGVSIPTLNKPNTTVIDVETEIEPSEIDVTYRGSTKPKYNLFLAQNGDSFEAKDGQSLYIGGGL